MSEAVGAVVASIGMLHPWNVAGAGLDLRAASDLKLRVTTALTAVSSQGREPGAVFPLPDAAIAAQIDALPWDAIGAVRVGALGGAAAHRLVRELLAGRDVPVVVDPVLRASTGESLAPETELAAVREWLAVPHAIVTPNADEAAALLGTPPRTAEAGARALLAFGARGIVVKGGHAPGDAVDTAADPSGVFEVRSERLNVDMRGTGCLFALALAGELARGASFPPAVAAAHAFVRTRLLEAARFAGFAVAY